MGDAVERVVSGQRQADLVSAHVSLQSDPWIERRAAATVSHVMLGEARARDTTDKAE